MPPGTFGIETIQSATKFGRTGRSRAPWRGRDAGDFDLAIRWLERVARPPFYVQVWARTPHWPVPRIPKGLTNANTTAFSAHFETRLADGLNTSLLGPGMKAKVARLWNSQCERHENETLSNHRKLRSGLAAYLGELMALDASIARLLAAVDTHDLRNSTVVVFSSDHGPEDLVNPTTKMPRAAELGSTGLCRGCKGTWREGGVRVPYLVRWPGRVPAGRVDDESVVSHVDWFPTLLAAASVPLQPRQFALDGENVLPRWLGERGPRTAPLFWSSRSVDGWGAAMRLGPHKITMVHHAGHAEPLEEVAVHHIPHDPAEAHPLGESGAAGAGLARSLCRRLDAFLDACSSHGCTEKLLLPADSSVLKQPSAGAASLYDLAAIDAAAILSTQSECHGAVRGARQHSG